jgi:hypothetical protein
MKDATLEQARIAKETVVRSSKVWEWGPFGFGRTDYGICLYYFAAIQVWCYRVSIGLHMPPSE